MQAAIRVSIKFEKVRESFLTLGVPKSPEDGLVAERVLAALHHKLKLVVDIVRGLLLQTSPPHKNEESDPGAANGKPGIATQAECSRISYSHSSERQNRGRSMQGREREIPGERWEREGTSWYRLLCGHHGCAPRRSDGGEDC